ncbi:anti-sigma regulatory factor [Coralloluteibacterium stylophorae]|uniref:Anti-sigma regulatory factor n=1 Tax=Coralloluteibacterium stylophorae TaxID=1776034 RepID=A0A8J7VR34_9GAMM|nr:anti-sigma regulatory factor [Coralloluteibacterium stylophorae]MBS7457433.1 anti-sigma regulatory factor [Coralloluteibacterium stylophorae]
MQTTHSEVVPLRAEQDVVHARQAVRRLAQERGFRLIDQTKLVTATSELSRNTIVYGRGGELRIEVVEDGIRTGLRLTFADEGPGIADLGLALTDGWTSGNGLGMGLSGSRRLVNEFDIDTAPGAGTRVTVVRWR